MATMGRAELKLGFDFSLIGTSVGIAVGRRSGGRLATMLVATIFIIIFFPVLFFSVVTFSHRRCARIKKLI